MDVERIAKVVEAEASVLDYQGKLGVAQCIVDNDYNLSLFATPASKYSNDSMQAVIDVVQNGKRRFSDKKILQFRSFTKYANTDGTPNFEKIYTTMPNDLIFLGADSTGEWGHFYFGKEVDIMENFKMLLITGHGQGDCGAVGCGYKEADLTRELVKLIHADAQSKGINVDVADTEKNWYKFLKNGGNFDFSKYDYVLEVHFNASTNTDYAGDGIKKGSMFFIHPEEKGWSVEQKILNNLYALGSKKAWNGIVLSTDNYNGGLLVQNRVKAQGVSHGLLETCFVSDMDDMRWYQTNKNKIASAIVQGIIDGFGLTPTKTFEPYKVFVDVSEIYDKCLNIREQPNGESKRVDTITEDMTVTIVEESENWGLLKSYQTNRNGWICLDFAKRV